MAPVKTKTGLAFELVDTSSIGILKIDRLLRKL
jgi:hypothetical protein